MNYSEVQAKWRSCFTRITNGTNRTNDTNKENKQFVKFEIFVVFELDLFDRDSGLINHIMGLLFQKGL
jgi:hypothetical protein